MTKLKRPAVGEIWYDNSGNRCYYRDNGTISCQTVNDEPTRTDQSQKDDCDLAKVILRFLKTGICNNIRSESPLFGDFSNIIDFRTALQSVNDVEDAFMALSADVRKRFHNDPANLIDFLADPSNRDEAIKLGLIVVDQNMDKDVENKNPPKADDKGTEGASKTD